MARRALIAARGSGKTLDILGQPTSIAVSAEDSDGGLYAFTQATPPGDGVPPHVHTREDETVFVEEGEFEVWLDGETRKAGKGDVIFLPRNVPHGYRNAGARPGRTFWTVTPGRSFEAFFTEIGAFPPGPPDPERLAALCDRYGIRMLPPA